jgi:hypothetical protein
MFEALKRVLDPRITELLKTEGWQTAIVESAIGFVEPLMVSLDSDARSEWEDILPPGQITLLSYVLSRLHEQWLRYSSAQTTATSIRLASLSLPLRVELEESDAWAERTTAVRQAMSAASRMIGSIIEVLKDDDDYDLATAMQRMSGEKNLLYKWHLARLMLGLAEEVMADAVGLEERVERSHPERSAVVTYNYEINRLSKQVVRHVDNFMAAIDADMESQGNIYSDNDWRERSQMAVAHIRNLAEVAESVAELLAAMAKRPNISPKLRSV